MGPDELIGQLVQLLGDPADATLRARVADRLADRGAVAEALAVLAPLVNLTGHEEDPPLPCLCKACLPGAGTAAELEGVAFQRAFVVRDARVLHYWLLDELVAQRAEVKRAVGTALQGRLKRRRKARA